MSTTFVAGLEDDAPLGGATRDVLIGGDRSFTPGRSRSNNHSRPHSRGGRLGTDQEEEDDEHLIRQRLSRRKERRWDNDRRIGADAAQALSGVDLLGRDRRNVLNLAAYDPDLGEFDVNEASRLIYEREGYSVFDDFDDEMRAMFLEGYCGETKAPKGRANRDKEANGPDMSAKARFARLDKNLKHHLLTTGSREPFTSFLGELETLLVEALESKREERLLRAPCAVRRVLVREPRLVKVCKSFSVELVFKTGVHRLLTHALSQWHGLVSSSSFLEHDDDVGPRQKVVFVKNPKNDAQLSGWSVVEPLPGTHDVDVNKGDAMLLSGEPVLKLVPFLLL